MCVCSFARISFFFHVHSNRYSQKQGCERSFGSARHQTNQRWNNIRTYAHWISEARQKESSRAWTVECHQKWIGSSILRSVSIAWKWIQINSKAITNNNVLNWTKEKNKEPFLTIESHAIIFCFHLFSNNCSSNVCHCFCYGIYVIHCCGSENIAQPINSVAAVVHQLIVLWSIEIVIGCQKKFYSIIFSVFFFFYKFIRFHQKKCLVKIF